MLKSNVPEYFKGRREKLARLAPGAAFIFPSNPAAIRNSNVEYPYRQESNFYYLSGFEEAESFLVIVTKSPRPAQIARFYLCATRIMSGRCGRVSATVRRLQKVLLAWTRLTRSPSWMPS